MAKPPKKQRLSVYLEPEVMKALPRTRAVVINPSR